MRLGSRGAAETGTRAGDAERIWRKSKLAAATTWARTGRRLRTTGTLLLVLVLGVTGVLALYAGLQRTPMPRLRLDYGPGAAGGSPGARRGGGGPFNASKVALLIESRAAPNLAPLLVHFMAVVPADWRFRFMGSRESVAWVNRSHAVRAHVAAGKLDLTYIPANMSAAGQEMISRFLTTRWLYESVLRPAEWLLVFQTDSVLCANARRSLDDFLGYDWVGAPWDPAGRFGGNGGLSLRRVSAIVEILRDQVRVDGSEPEDVWLTERLGHRPGARMANGSLSLIFSGEMNAGQNVQAHRPVSTSATASSSSSSSSRTTASTSSGERQEDEGEDEDGDGDGEDDYIEGIDDWRDGFYEPMGYHTGGSGTLLHAGVWGTPRLRKHIWDYCPEVKMTLAMDAAKYVPGDCQANWKRDSEGMDGGFVGIEDFGYGTEEIDGVVYPMLPPNLVPW
ncbi:hypothetical protein SAMD00023353_3700610 [Rosellinia necatrix]|uniref:DUF5672 domain-containing protein n=1 Tax=Rosellinia necatrix TaxID=77044 RepID=A0A1W2TLY1_ROSNE|nr:hypothetical protein SAMD00023353_3700610 [Rosellinia necatrix]